MTTFLETKTVWHPMGRLTITRVDRPGRPSGSGKSDLAERLGLPVLRLDDFYKDGDDPTLPRLDWPARPDRRLGRPRLLERRAAVAAIEELCRTGVPTAGLRHRHELAHRPPRARPRRRGVLRGRGHLRPEVVAAARAGAARGRGLRHPAPVVTFVRRLTRDLREHRKPPLVLVRRGLQLLGPTVCGPRAQDSGCRVLAPGAAYAEIRALTG